jgi:hypothetical protein
LEEAFVLFPFAAFELFLPALADAVSLCTLLPFPLWCDEALREILGAGSSSSADALDFRELRRLTAVSLAEASGR